jgi:hypothetical protein
MKATGDFRKRQIQFSAARPSRSRRSRPPRMLSKIFYCESGSGELSRLISIGLLRYVPVRRRSDA